jgi:hypothetical protein
MYRNQLVMSSEVERDVVWALRTAGVDLTADEVIIRIADSLGHAYPQIEIENVLEELAKTGKTLKGTATGRATYKWLGPPDVRRPQRLAS